MEPVTRKNLNRGYMQLVVWQDAKDYYVLTSTIFRKFPYELKRVASQQIASVDSIHRIQSLQNKRESGDWNDSFVVRESNEAYQAANPAGHEV